MSISRSSYPHTDTEPHFELRPNGDAALDICFFAEPSEALSETIIAMAEMIKNARLTAVTELVPAYQCLTVCFDPLQLPYARSGSGPQDVSELEETLAALTEKALTQKAVASGEHSLVRIPVCYEGEFAPDMQALCSHTGLTVEEIVRRHTAPRYLVHMLGFTPGFLYLGGLDRELHCPRKSRPALRVPAGSVGIGGTQTGIYPQATPGGWQIIGRTPLALFRPQRERPYIAHPLDRIQFVAISEAEFADIAPLTEPEKVPLEQADAAEVKP